MIWKAENSSLNNRSKRWLAGKCLCLLTLISIVVLINSCIPEKKTSFPRTLPFYSTPQFTPQWFDRGEVPETFHRIPNFKLINQLGDTITNETYQNKIYVTDFFFTTCPGICVDMTKNMMAVHDKFMDTEQVMILSHSVTPEIDSVQVLKEYAQVRGIKSKTWHLATGDRNIIYSLGRNSYFVEEKLGINRDPDDFLHTENFVLVDQNRYIRGIYNGLDTNAVDQLILDIRLLLE